MKISCRWVGFFVVALAIGALIVWLAVRYPEVLAGQGRRVDLTHSLIWLGLIGTSLFLHRRLPLGHAAKYAAIWVAIGAGLVLAYSFRHDAREIFERMKAELLPHTVRIVGEAVEIRAGRHGHFLLEADVDGVAIRFLVDTGASDVILTLDDATRLGFRSENLTFNKLYRTANGMVRAAPVKIKRMKVGSITLKNVRASVNRADAFHSLLGMSFLGRLSGYEVRGDRMVLRP